MVTDFTYPGLVSGVGFGGEDGEVAGTIVLVSLTTNESTGIVGLSAEEAFILGGGCCTILLETCAFSDESLLPENFDAWERLSNERSILNFK